MKKNLLMLLFVSLIATMFATVGQAAQVVPKLFLNGERLESDVSPQIVNDYTMVPLATLSDGMGYSYEWEHKAKKVTVYDGDNSLVLTINDKNAIVNGKSTSMATTAKLMNNRTMVPLSFIGRQFGLDFEWKHAEKEVHMTSKPPVEVLPSAPAEEEKQPEVEAKPEPETEDSKNQLEPAQPEEGSSDQDEEAAVDPLATTGWIKQVTYSGNGSIKLAYDGIVTIGKPMYLENPNRIVIDFHNTDYTDVLKPFFENGPIEAKVMNDPYIHNYRYSMFDVNPAVSRLVIEVGEDAGVVVTDKTQWVQVDIMSASDASATVPVEEEPIDDGKLYNIVIDAGHGDSDPGAPSINGRWEKEFNLIVALKVQALLNQETSLKGHMTRADDTFVELADRVKFAENLEADLFISIHSNSIDKPAITGTETYYSRADSKPFADVMHKHMLKATELRDRYVKKANFKVIKDTTMPAILLEAGYLSNSGDAKLLFTEQTQNRIAEAIVAGVKEYLKIK